MRVLPFDDDAFTWTRFESFCLAIVRALPEVKRAERYGKTGEKQRGIDIEADLYDGRKRTIQCRLRERFTKANAEKTVADTTYKAGEHEIWVTCDVGTAVSDYIDGIDRWSLSSREGISQTVRELPRERARRIVEDAFGAAVRRAFLGPDGPIAFETPDDHFAPLDAPGRLLRHDLELVGRDGELRALTAAVANDAVRFVVLPGRGGIGKTRLLRAAAAALPARTLFAREGAELTAEAVDDLPFEPVTVFVDDAHHADVSLRPLLSAALRRADPITVVAAVRPGAVDAIHTVAAEIELDTAQVTILPELEPLPGHAVEQLAAAALGRSSRTSERLAAATGETPMITVIGGRLLARGALAGAGPQASDAELRRAVLARFSAELLGQVTPKVPTDAARELATVVAALQPLNVRNDRLIELVSAELGIAASKVRRWLADLQAAGLIVARGDLRRLTPDVLADQLLLDACLDAAGDPTGYALELWERFGADAAESLLRNLADIDWRIGRGSSSLLDTIWQKVERRFLASSAFGREKLIRTIGRAAYAIPERVLRLVRLALENPAEPTEWPGLTDMRIDDASVRHELPQLLRAAGAHPAHASQAMELLWELARDDDRPTNPHPNHPLRVLTDLGGYDHTAAHHNALLELVEREALRRDVDDHPNSPLPLASALLAREGMTSHSRGLTWQLGSYTVNAEATQRWRRRIRALLVDRALRGSARQQLIAAELFGDALRLPHGYFGRSVGRDVLDSWQQDQVELLDAIETIEQSTSEPAVRQALAAALRWHGDHGPWPDIQARAGNLRSRLTGPDEELVAALAAPWGILDLDAKRERDNRVARRLIDAHPSPDALARALDELVADIAARGQSASPEWILGAVFECSSEHASGFAGWALQNSKRRLAAAYGVALDRLRRSSGDVDDLVRRGWQSGASALRRGVAAYLSSGAWFDDPRDTELEVLEASVHDTDPVIANITATTLLRLQQSDPQLAMRLALEVEFDKGHPDADTTFAIFKDGGIDKMSDADLDRLTERLALVPELGYFASAVLGDLGLRDSDRFVSVWSRRLENDADGFQAVPFHDFRVEMLPANRDDRVSVLRSLIGHANRATGWTLLEIGRLVWQLVLPGFDDDEDDVDEQLVARAQVIDDALAELGRWIGVAQDDGHVSEVLIELPWVVLLDRAKWVHTILEQNSGTRRVAVESGLHGAAFSGGHGRTLGEDSKRLTRTEEAARNAAESLPVGSAAERLFSDIARIARKEIEEERRRDEEIDAGWS
jgi:hypothetical protein